MATQLAQLAAGWQASFDGPKLIGGATGGTYAIDVRARSAELNGEVASLGMCDVLADWLAEELVRLDRSPDWIASATVIVAYELIPADVFMRTPPGVLTSQSFMAELCATARVVTPDGSAECVRRGAQALLDGSK